MCSLFVVWCQCQPVEVYCWKIFSFLEPWTFAHNFFSSAKCDVIRWGSGREEAPGFYPFLLGQHVSILRQHFLISMQCRLAAKLTPINQIWLHLAIFNCLQIHPEWSTYLNSSPSPQKKPNPTTHTHKTKQHQYKTFQILQSRFNFQQHFLIYVKLYFHI